MPIFFSKKKEAEDDKKKRSSRGDDNDKGRHHASSTADEKTHPSHERRRSSRRTEEPHSTTPRRSSRRQSTADSSGRDEAGLDKGNDRGSQHSMPPIHLTGSSPKLNSRNDSAFAVSSTSDKNNGSPSRNGAAATEPTKRQSTSSSKVQLPVLTSAQSLHSGSGTPDSSLTPTIGSAPQMKSKASSAGAVKDVAELTEMAPMQRHTAADPPTGPLRKMSIDAVRDASNRSSLKESGVGSSAEGSATSPSAFSRTVPGQPVRIADEVTTPNAKRTRTAAELTATVAAAAARPPEVKQPAAIFSAMESVPKRPGSSFRLQKRRKSSQEAAGVDNGKNNSSFSTSTNTVGTSASDMTRKERQANGGASSHGRRREPVAAFTGDVADVAPRSSISARSGSLNVPLPPPMAVDSLAPHNDKDGGDDVVPPSRRSRRSSMRQQPQLSSISLRNVSLSSSDDLPRPLTRHASTLSSGQKEALRKTPSFLSRVHTPPPGDLRESVHIRRGRRSSMRDAATSSGAAAATATESPPLSVSQQRPDISFASDSTIMLSGVLPPSSDESKPASSSNKRETVSATPSLPLSLPSPPPADRDTAPAVASVSSSFRLQQVRPASRAPRTLMSSSASDSKSSIPSPTAAGASTHGNGSAAALGASSSFSPPSVARPSSARSMQLRQRQDLLQKNGPPLSVSPEPAVTRKAEAARSAGGASSSQPAAAASSNGSEPVNIVASNASVFSSEAELFDYYGSFMLTAPQFNRSSGRLIPTPPPSEEPAVKHAAKASAEVARSTETTSKKASVGGSASFVSESASFGDVLGLSPAPPASTKMTASADPPKLKTVPHPPATQSNTSAAPAEPVRGVRPAGRHRQVNTYVDEDDENSIFQTAKDASEMTSTGYDYMFGNDSSIKGGTTETPSPAPPASSQSATVTSVPSPAKRLIAQALPANVAVPPSSSAMNRMSSSDDEEDEEEEAEGLLEGFRPALFDAARDRRRGSAILFFLDKEDSLSSLDVVVKVSAVADGRSQAATILSPLADEKLHQHQAAGHKASSPASQTGAATAAAVATTAGRLLDGSVAEAIARPRVTLEPYVPLGSVGSSSVSGASPLHSTPSNTNSSTNRGETTGSKSFSLLMDPYGLHLDSSTPSLPVSVPKLTKKASVSRTGAGKSITEVPTGIFLGTTSRFAPNPEKMHRPLANTFGYTSAQRRARAAAMAAGVSAEAWETSAGLDDVDLGEEDEENVYKEVYTDENGDEWYWEEVEEGEDEEYEDVDVDDVEEEAAEEVEEEGTRKPAMPKATPPHVARAGGFAGTAASRAVGARS